VNLLAAASIITTMDENEESVSGIFDTVASDCNNKKG
jgi:hypothetical protein